jgi:hypothetical protein
MKYYKIEDDLSIKGRWMLTELNFPPKSIISDLEQSENFFTRRWKIHETIKGKLLDFTFVDFEFMAVNQKCLDILTQKKWGLPH